MTVNDFMKEHIEDIKNDIIPNIPMKEFDSHEFIRHFMRKYEVEYVEFLTQYYETPFQNVNKQIGGFLARNTEYLNIMDMGKTSSKNEFGVVSENEKWQKVS